MNHYSFSLRGGGIPRYVAMVAAVILVVAVFGLYTARAATTGTVNATVTATNLAVSVTSGSIAFGSVALCTATTTVGST